MKKPEAASETLRMNVPPIRDGEALMRRYEQLWDAQERKSVTPKQAEQMNMTLKGIRWFADLQLRYLQMLAKHQGRTPAVTGQMLQTVLGVEPQPATAALAGEARRELGE